MGSHSNLTIHSVGKVPRIASIRGVAIYDSKSGAVRHLHHVITLEGASASDWEALERRAAEQAEQRGVRLKETKMLRLPNTGSVKGPFRVDVKTRKLVPFEIRKPRPDPSSAGKKRKASK